MQDTATRAAIIAPTGAIDGLIAYIEPSTNSLMAGGEFEPEGRLCGVDR